MRCLALQFTLLLQLLLVSSSWVPTSLATESALEISPAELRLRAGSQTWRFDRAAGHWALAGIEVKGKIVARPLSRADSFWVGAGEAVSYEVPADTPAEKAVRFSLAQGSVTCRVRSSDSLPLVHWECDRTNETVCALCAGTSAAQEHGAWVTRGWVATDTDASEAFIDASNPWVFGHSAAGDLDVAYAFLPEVKGHPQTNGRTEQRTGTFFKAHRRSEAGGDFRAVWQWRLGENEPKALALLFDRDLGGRMSDVCEKYFAGAVDMLVDLAKVPRSSFDPEKCLQVMPIRLAAPDAFIPGGGMMMDEFPNASYP